MRSRARLLPRLLLAVMLAALTLVGVSAAGMATIMQNVNLPDPVGERERPVPRPSSDGPITVAVVLGQSATVGSDLLAPYEVFASSSTFSVYTVAESSAPAPIGGGPALLPTYSFADIDSGAAAAPDVVVVPAVGDPDGEQEATLRAWIRRQYERGAHLFGVCAGSRLLAATGLLDGHRATSHWQRISSLEKDFPAVKWVRGERYVQDGSITTTGGITSGIPGALKLVRDLVGPQEAQRIGRSLNYPGWSLEASTRMPEQGFAASDAPVALARVLPWLRPTVGIGLADGMREIDIAAVFEVYEVSAAARAVPIGTGNTVTTRHGVVLFTTPTDAVDAVDRLVVPASGGRAGTDPELRRWAVQRDVDIEPLQRTEGEPGFDAALRHLAEHTDRSTAVSTAKLIDYPIEHLDLAADGRAWRVPALLLLSLLLALGMGLLPTLAMKAAGRRRGTREGAAPVIRPLEPRNDASQDRLERLP